MRPILYSSDELLFTSEGRGRLADCTRCIVTEERNGIYLCEFDYPVTGPMYAALLEGGIVGVIHDDQHDIQPFDIYGHTAPLDGMVTFYARHISYRLSNVILKPMTAASCAAALSAFQTQTYNSNPFTFWTDKAVSGTWTNDAPASVKSRLVGEQGSILDVYGKGEYKFDKWAVRLYVNRGNDNGVSIRYGVNLTQLTEDVDSSSSYSAVAPFWRSGDGQTVVALPEGYIVASNALVQTFYWTTETGEIVTTGDGEPIEVNIPQVIPVPMDLSAEFQEAPTVAQLRALAQTRLNNSSAWLPNTNIKISFVDLAHTEDYKDVAALQRVSLCDRVNVYCGPLGVSAAKVEVVRVVYNVLAEQYDEMELGQPSRTYAETVMAQVQQLVSDRPTASMLKAALDSATEQITGAKDSHITFVYDANGGLQEILIMDTDDVNTATKVWRWNSGGLGYSSNGYAGPYGLAITQDGAIVADFITTGKLSANVIKANSIGVGKLTGTISGGLNNTWVLDLSNGTLTIGNISAENITAGTLDADRFAANSISVGKLTGSVIGGLNNSWVLNLTDGTFTIGNISAANVTTGTMVADRISGGTLKLGGANNANGLLQILNASGTVIGTWDRTGINISQGSIQIPLSSGTNDFIKINGNDAFVAEITNNGGSTRRIRIDGNILAFEDANVPSTQSVHAGYSGNRINIECNDGTTNPSIRLLKSNSTSSENTTMLINHKHIEIDFDTNTHKTTVGTDGFYTYKDLKVIGTKSRVVQTNQYADRLLYCYETPSPMFGDVGEGVIGDDGLCYVTIDPVFAETITDSGYQVFLQRYGEGDAYVKERRGGWFVVTGTPGLSFGWEIKAKQRDYDQRRLERNDEPFTVPAQTYGADAAAHIDGIRKARISA